MKTKKMFLVLAACCTLFAACDKNNNDVPDPHTGKKATLIVGVNMQPLAQNGYLIPLSDLDAKSIIGSNLSGAVETKITPYAIPFGDDFFYSPGINDNSIIKYGRSDDGKIVERGRLQVAFAGPGIGSIAILNEHKAYASSMMDQKIVIFDPTTMTKTGEIDLAKKEFSVNKEKPAPSPIGLIINEGILYVGTGQFTQVPKTAKGAYVIPIDTKTDLPGKMFEDQRLSSASIFPCGMFKDEKGDVYVTCWGSYGYDPGQKFGILRIKKGEKSFDPDYCFNMSDMNIKDVLGGKLNYMITVFYGGNGQIFTYGANYGLSANPNKPDAFEDKVLYCMKGDLAKKTLEVLPLPHSNMYSTAISRYGDQILFGLSPKGKPSGIYTYNLKTGKCDEKPVVEIPGTIISMASWK